MCQIRLIIYLPRMCLLNVTVVLLYKQSIIYLSYLFTPSVPACLPAWPTSRNWTTPVGAGDWHKVDCYYRHVYSVHLFQIYLKKEKKSFKLNILFSVHRIIRQLLMMYKLYFFNAIIIIFFLYLNNIILNAWWVGDNTR